MTSIVKAIAVGCVLIAIAGCSMGGGAVSAPAEQRRPEPQIPLTCDEIPMDDFVSQQFGLGLVADTTLQPDLWFRAMDEQSGTMTCYWGVDVLGAQVTIYRHAELRLRDEYVWFFDEYALDPGFAPPAPVAGADRGAASCDVNGGFICIGDARVGDYVAFFHAESYNSTAPDAAALSQAFADMIGEAAAALASRPVPEQWFPPEGGWPLVMDCGQFANLDLSGILGPSPIGPEDRSQEGERAGSDFGPARDLAALDAGSDCGWAADSTYSSTIVVRLGAGAGWYFDLPDWPDREALSIPGADEAWLVCNPAVDPAGSPDSGCQVSVRIGVNVIRVDTGFGYSGRSVTRTDLIAVATMVTAQLS